VFVILELLRSTSGRCTASLLPAYCGRHDLDMAWGCAAPLSAALSTH
jgi:hypothetical protein